MTTITLQHVLAGLEPELRNSVLNVYVMGSRALGTASESSDWDFTIVIKSRKNSKGEDFEFYESFDVQGTTIDCQILSEQEMNLYVTKKFHMEYLSCLFLPPQCIWLEKVQFNKYAYLQNVEAFKKALVSDLTLLLKQSKERYGVGNKSQKILILTFMFAEMAINLLSQQDITHLPVYTHFNTVIRQYPETADWNAMFTTFYPELEKLLAKLQLSINTKPFV